MQTVNTGTPANFEATLEHNAAAYDAFQAFLDGLNSPGMVDGSTFIITRLKTARDFETVQASHFEFRAEAGAHEGQLASA